MASSPASTSSTACAAYANAAGGSTFSAAFSLQQPQRPSTHLYQAIPLVQSAVSDLTLTQTTPQHAHNAKSAHSGWGNKPECQICPRFGHEVIQCRERYNPNFQSSSPTQAPPPQPRVMAGGTWFTDSTHSIMNRPSQPSGVHSYSSSQQLNTEYQCQKYLESNTVHGWANDEQKGEYYSKEKVGYKKEDKCYYEDKRRGEYSYEDGRGGEYYYEGERRSGYYLGEKAKYQEEGKYCLEKKNKGEYFSKEKVGYENEGKYYYEDEGRGGYYYKDGRKGGYYYENGRRGEHYSREKAEYQEEGEHYLEDEKKGEYYAKEKVGYKIEESRGRHYYEDEKTDEYYLEDKSKGEYYLKEKFEYEEEGKYYYENERRDEYGYKGEYFLEYEREVVDFSKEKAQYEECKYYSQDGKEGEYYLDEKAEYEDQGGYFLGDEREGEYHEEAEAFSQLTIEG